MQLIRFWTREFFSLIVRSGEKSPLFLCSETRINIGKLKII